MAHKIMTSLYIFLVAAVGSIDIAHIEPLFKDVIFLLILVCGIIMSLTLDDKRPDVQTKITFGYVAFSVAASVFFSTLSVAAYIEFNFQKFYFYLLIGLTTTLSPQFARRLLPEAPNELKDGVFSLFRSFINGLASKLNNTNDNETK